MFIEDAVYPNPFTTCTIFLFLEINITAEAAAADHDEVSAHCESAIMRCLEYFLVWSL